MKDCIFRLNSWLIDKHLPDKRWNVHVLCEKYDAEEGNEDESSNTFLNVSLNAFHQVTEALGDEGGVIVYPIIVDDDSICTAVRSARRADVIIFLMRVMELCRQAFVGRGFHQHRNTLRWVIGHD